MVPEGSASGGGAVSEGPALGLASGIGVVPEVPAPGSGLVLEGSASDRVVIPEGLAVEQCWKSQC